MDVDDIFKRPPLPKHQSTKRKLDHEPSFDPEAYKHIKLDPSATGDDDQTHTSEEPTNAREFAPNQDADYFEEEDEDGRFFGGGLSTVQKQVLNIFDGGDDPDARDSAHTAQGHDLTPQGVRKMLLALERTVNKNRDLRTKFPTDPEK
ncbi:hypothetical protein JCM10212_004394 [Sporobolomyces blumeae]